MALSNDEKQKVIDMLDSMDSKKAKAILESENSFVGWLQKTASWLWERIKNNIGYIFDVALRFVFGY